MRNRDEVRILVVDDEQGMRDMLSLELGALGYRVVAAADGLEALECLKKEKFQIIISDVMMPKLDGITFLNQAKKIDSDVEVIITTGYGTVETAVKAMKQGAYDFVPKPFNLEEMFALVEKALEKNDLKALVALHESSKAVFSTIKLSELFEKVMDLVQKVIRADESSIMLVDYEDMLYIAACRGIPAKVARKTRIKIGERVAGRVAQEKRGFLLINGLEKYPEFHGVQSNSRIRASIVVPLLAQNQFLGILNLNRTTTQEVFTHADFRHATLFAAQVAQAVQNAILYQDLEKKSVEAEHAYQSLKEAQARLVQSEKLASIGCLISGFVHEIKNPLTVIMGYAEMLEKAGLAGEKQNRIGKVVKESKRCLEIVQDLLNFAGKQKLELQKVDPVMIMEDALETLALEFKKHGIEVVRKNLSKGPILEADPERLKQVFLNLLMNARDALSGSKKKPRITVSAKTTADFFEVEVSDNGPGIAPENLTKIFDPFFTTKGAGKGTGLGLSLSYGIVREHGGSLSVQSQVGQGAFFLISLPVSPSMRAL